ncbi:MAG: hypothetical protein GAK43_02282 [Stenotrophomonas maltophilia]|nr:MAG: hypothetical protein GAK43_02282 [Stenotrophomonas maltophilia]
MSVKPRLILAAASLLAVSSAFAFNLGDAAKAASGMMGNNSASSAASTPQTGGLLGALTGDLGVNQQQAVGGTGALLGLAKNKLDSGDYSELVKEVPGLDKLSGSNVLGSLGGQLGSLVVRNPRACWATPAAWMTSTRPSAPWAWTRA